MNIPHNHEAVIKQKVAANSYCFLSLYNEGHMQNW